MIRHTRINLRGAASSFARQRTATTGSMGRRPARRSADGSKRLTTTSRRAWTGVCGTSAKRTTRPAPGPTAACKRDVSPGETVKLAATATDPDGDKLTARWWHETKAELSSAPVAIANSDSPDQASFVVPDEPGKQVYVILEVTDDGAPPLVGYQRLIFNIK